MTKLTKITATIGPASDSHEMIESLIKAGVNIFRFNFKHNTIEWHGERIKRVNEIAEKMGVSIGTLIDLQGPEIRINMPVDQLELKIGDKLLFGEKSFENTTVPGFSISHPDIIPYLEQGQKLVADDGAFSFHVERQGKITYLISESNGTLKHRKSLNIPGADFPFPVLVDRDFEGLQLAAKNEIDFVALSFVRTVEDLKTVRREMQKFNVKGKLVAKIETQKALDHLDAIIAETDAIMVARGDLGVELPAEQVPFYQKLMIKKSIEKGVSVITATQMLQSMINNPFPTRAEVSDIANATYDFTDAVMLSGETASGLYPLETVKVMRKTVQFNEKQTVGDIRARFHYGITDQEEVMADTAYNVYLRSYTFDGVQAFVVFTQTGRTARLVSRYRPHVPIYAITPSKIVADSLTVNFGIHPVLAESMQNSDVHKDEVMKVIETLTEEKLLEKGKKVIVLHGDIWGKERGTSTVKVVTP